MNNHNVLTLPDEILFLICQELGQDRDFATLYCCAQSASTLADSALRTMYLIHELSPTMLQSDEDSIKQRGVEFDIKLKQQTESFRKWTVLWRSIIASSIDGMYTYKPYCRYLRILDFRNLSQMMDDLKFGGKIRKAFFAGSLHRFHFPKAEFKRQGVDTVATVNAIGEAVVPKTYLLEEIAGQLSPGFLTRWIGFSPKLRSLVLYKGDALAESAGSAIKERCEQFQSLTIHGWTNPDADHVFAQFLDGLEENTLQYFEMISRNSLETKSFQALGRHKSLRDLRLGNLSQQAVENLNQLKECTEIETLVLEDTLGTVQLEALNNDVFLEVVQWLSSCSKLRDLSLKNLYDGPSILAQVAVSPDVKLTKLSLEGYIVRKPSTQAFHTALSEQKSLVYLLLKGNGEDTTPDDLDIMVDVISSLPSLTELFLKDVSDEFEEHHIIRLALSLLQLEEFWTSGQYVSSAVLDVIAQMPRLNNLALCALTRFSFDDIVTFVSKLNPVAQKNFSLGLMNADPEWDLTEQEQEFIHGYLRSNLDGRFEFILWREADSSDSDDD